MNPPPVKPLKKRLGRIGLGTATFGREIDPDDSFAMMDHARVRGIALFDTASTYSDGISEQVVGAWLASRRPGPDELVVATKLRAPYTPKRIEEMLGRSLRYLGRESVELYYLHEWDDTAVDPTVLAALEEVVRSGKAGALAVSNFSGEQLERILRLQSELGFTPFRAVQNNHNFAIRNVDDAVLRASAGHNLAVITYSPLGAGFLTGKHKGGVAPGSRFDIMPGHRKKYFQDQAWHRLAQLEAAAARTGRSLPQLALAWVMRQPGINTVLVGGRTPAHLDQAFAALEFSAAEFPPELE